MNVMEQSFTWLPKDSDKMALCHLLSLLEEKNTLCYVQRQMAMYAVLLFSSCPAFLKKKTELTTKPTA